ncbi:MAG: TauD/TfdA family dioxygenase, partial [Pseudomonadota bacterium]|nr:TauD/TfdA family dioxygenase [Pseudomonadota bacterium]
SLIQRYDLLIIPDQRLTDEQQIEFSEQLGPLETTKPGSTGAGSKLVTLSNLDTDGYPVEPSHRQNLIRRANQLWHADSSFKPIPAKLSILSARQIPDHGGETQFVNMRSVYTALPNHEQEKCDGYIAIHDFAHSRKTVDPNLMTDEERAAVPPVRQPLTIDHDEHRGRSLYIGSHVSRIEGLSKHCSQQLINRLITFSTQDKFIYSHHWKVHDLLIWNNLTVIHRGTPLPDPLMPRVLVRTTIAGDKPLIAC